MIIYEPCRMSCRAYVRWTFSLKHLLYSSVPLHFLIYFCVCFLPYDTHVPSLKVLLFFWSFFILDFKDFKNISVPTEFQMTRTSVCLIGMVGCVDTVCSMSYYVDFKCVADGQRFYEICLVCSRSLLCNSVVIRFVPFFGFALQKKVKSVLKVNQNSEFDIIGSNIIKVLMFQAHTLILLRISCKQFLRMFGAAMLQMSQKCITNKS